MTNILFRPRRHQYENDVNRFFKGRSYFPFHHFSDERSIYSAVHANVRESASQYTISLAIPGYEKSAINISLDKNRLTVKGNNQVDQEVKYTSKEFDYSNFERVFYLPEGVQIDKIDAKNENGILYIAIPKAEAKPVVSINVK